MTGSAWLVVHLVAAAVLTGVGWVVQLVVYPAFALVGAAEWTRYHERHRRAITAVVAPPWLAQGVSTAVLLFAPGPGGRAAAAALAALALVTVATTVVAAVPAHDRLAAVGAADGPGGDAAGPGGDADGPGGDAAGGPAGRVTDDLAALLRANLTRTLAWTGSTALAAVLLI